MTKKLNGFTLIELLITLTIVGIIASVAVYSFALYSKRSRAAELVNAASGYKKAVAICMQKNSGDTSVCSEGQQGIPEAVSTSLGYVASRTVLANGVIRITGTSDVDDVVYELVPTVDANGHVTFQAQASDCSLFGANCVGSGG